MLSRSYIIRTRQFSKLSACCKQREQTKSSHHDVDKAKKSLKLESQPPANSQVDWIGPADPDSNLRPRRYHIPHDETTVERDFRQAQEETQRWNQQFWATHNKNFAQSKERFIQSELARLGPVLKDGSARRLSPENMAIFYRKFLKENFNHHKNYNIEWYRSNIKLLWPALKVACIRMFRKKKSAP